MDNAVRTLGELHHRRMPWDPDPDWYLDHVLAYAQPDDGTPIRVDEVTRWETWWRARARAVVEAWPELSAPALHQGFTLATRQVHAAGVRRPTARGLVERGRWGAPVRGTVALVGPAEIEADQPDRWTAARRGHALDSAAAVLTNPGHVITGNSSAVLHGLPVFALPSRPELSVPPGRTVRRRGARIADLPPSDLTRWYGSPLTGVPRTVVDLARAGRRDGIVVADAALRTGRVTRHQLDTALANARGWPGVRQAREIIDLADPLAESPLESILRLAIHDAGLPAPRLQGRFPIPGSTGHYRVDMVWDEQRLIVEADGRSKYRRSEHAPDDDPLWAEKRREVALRRLGYRVERVIWSDVVHRWADTYVLLADALAR